MPQISPAEIPYPAPQIIPVEITKEITILGEIPLISIKSVREACKAQSMIIVRVNFKYLINFNNFTSVCYDVNLIKLVEVNGRSNFGIL